MIRDATGNLVTPARLGYLEEAAGRRARALGLADLGAYVSALAAGELHEEWGFLAALVTIKESYFYRAPQQFEALRREVLPALLRARAGERRLRFWSAACARGEEPATLALLLAEDPSLTGWEWTIVATDLDAEALACARAGLYGERAVARFRARVALARWFTPRGKALQLAPGSARADHLPAAQPGPAPAYSCRRPPSTSSCCATSLPTSGARCSGRWWRKPRGSWPPTARSSGRHRRPLWPGQGRLVPVEAGGCFLYRFGTDTGVEERRPVSSPPRRSPPFPR